MEFLVRDPSLGYIQEDLWCPKAAINVEGVKRALTFQFFDKQTITILTLWRETEHHLLVPREFWDPKDYIFPVIDLLPKVFPRADIRSKVKLDHLFERGELRPTGKTVQRDAMAALESSRGGILQLACGAGKTVIALDYAARLKQPTIILLDTTELMRQWKEQIALHLDIPEGIGFIQGSQFDWKKPIVLATYHAVAARAATMPEEVRRWFGLAVFEEGHHLSAPTFSRAANLFYGKRLAITATPDREDGLNVIYDHHVGRIIYKNLDQELRPRIYFQWTGFGLDENDTRVQSAARDVNGDYHIGKISAFLGSFRPRIDYIIQNIKAALQEKRKVLVLSKSVDSLVNLLAAWNNQQSLVTDIPFPTAADVGETEAPSELASVEFKRLQRALHACIAKLSGFEKAGDDLHAQAERTKKTNIDRALEAHRVFKKCELLYNKQRKEYLENLLATESTAGLMIYRVKAEARAKMLREKQVTFAIAKYGREGLDERSLDTVFVIEPLSSRNGVQQLMGRVLRKKEGKREPVAVFFEDDIGPFIGMCKKLRHHFNDWPRDEGGPFTFENVGHPTKGKKAWNSTETQYETSIRLRGPGSSR